MMEIDPVPYIFGSFARRRPSHDGGATKRRSIDSTPAHTTILPASPSSTASSAADTRISCPTPAQSPNSPSPFHIRSISEPSKSPFVPNPVHNDGDIGASMSMLPVRLSGVKKTTYADSGYGINARSLAPANSSMAMTSASEEDDGVDWNKCPVCMGYFVDPKVLQCLHSCCLKCLQQLETFNEDDDTSNSGTGSTSGSRTGSTASGTGGSTDSAGDNTTDHRQAAAQRTHAHRRRPPRHLAADSWSHCVTCPVCGAQSVLGTDGVAALPPNYLLQHRLMLHTLNSAATKLLCDLCSINITATSRCMQCALSLCADCASIHRRQRSTSTHDVLLLDEARMRGITKIRKQLMCLEHPEKELDVFCSTCYQVICKECSSSPVHQRHAFEPVARAAKAGTAHVRHALDQVRSIAQNASGAVTQLHASADRVEAQCDCVERDVQTFMDAYRDAVERHRGMLVGQVQQAKRDKLMTIVESSMRLQKQMRNARDVATFTEELLRQSEPVEVMSFARLIRDRVESCAREAEGMRDLHVSESLQFLPEEVSQPDDEGLCCPLYGVVTTQTVAPKNCILNTDNLKNLRVGRRVAVTLETRDRSNLALQRGGETVTADLRHCDAGVTRSLPVTIDDLRDGTYSISFAPDVAGKLILCVYVKGSIVKQGPVPILVKTIRPHRGTYHCCSFCSSGGSKEATCGCSGTMPGGYRGCGHGHDGHPGRRHWSCCGNVLEHSECVRKNSTTIQQFTI